MRESPILKVSIGNKYTTCHTKVKHRAMGLYATVQKHKSKNTNKHRHKNSVLHVVSYKYKGCDTYTKYHKYKIKHVVMMGRGGQANGQ